MSQSPPKATLPDGLRETARDIRVMVVESLALAGSGHLGGSLGLADLLTYLYFSRMNHRPSEPQWPERDRLILSIGHVAPVLYAALAKAGYFPVEEMHSLRQLGSRLQGHPARDKGLPGIEISSGSLGQGLSVATGLALANRLDGRKSRVYCVHGDGELQEGSVWEALMSAAHYRLDNLFLLIDRNDLQIDGPTETVMGLEPLTDKLRAFGWAAEECNGNDFGSIHMAFGRLDSLADSRPRALIARTRMGCGVGDIENSFAWHGAVPRPDQVESFIQQIHESYLRAR